jgi:hypothetical protein
MPVYLVAQLNIHDRETYAKYGSAFMDIFNPYGGKLLSVEEAPEVLEGEWALHANRPSRIPLWRVGPRLVPLLRLPNHCATQAGRVRRQRGSHRRSMTPYPSIERTSSGRLRLLAAAAHVER